MLKHSNVLNVMQADCHNYVYLLNVVMLSVIMLSVIMLNIIMLNVMVPIQNSYIPRAITPVYKI
jgi:hypothetical protein